MQAAIELGGTKALCAVGAARDRLVAEARIETRAPEATVAAIAAFLAPHRDVITAVGVAAFGPLELNRSSADCGSLLRTPKAGWSYYPLRAELQRALHVPIAIDTDVNAAAIAEQRWGNARGADPCVYITVGTGVGVGVVIDGKPLHGLMHAELGHLPIEPDTSFAGVCPFHGSGCVEGIASAPALAARLQAAPESVADDHPVWNEEARVLARLVSTCVLAYAPQRIVLGGGVLARNGLLTRVQRELVSQLAGYVPRSELRAENVARYLVSPAFGTRAGLMGAFALLADTDSGT